MFFDKNIWFKFEKCLNCTLNWKIIVLGYSFGSVYTDCVEQCISMIAMSIYNYKIKCKMKDSKYNEQELLHHLKLDIKCFYEFLRLKHSMVVTKVQSLLQCL